MVAVFRFLDGCERPPKVRIERSILKSDPNPKSYTISCVLSVYLKFLMKGGIFRFLNDFVPGKQRIGRNNRWVSGLQGLQPNDKINET